MKIQEAFDAVRDGFSSDRVVADPELNMLFLARCRELGLEGDDATLNRSLLNLRKRGALSGRSRSKPTSFADEEEYRFAAEMAARFLERRDGVSLDAVICDPVLAREFDALAEQIVPGHSSLQYRWAALNLRKKKALEPELVSRVAGKPAKVDSFNVDGLNLDDVPRTQGVYLFYDSTAVLYIGEAGNLHQRIKKHLDHSDNKGLARWMWMWEFGDSDLHLELQVLPPETDDRIRKALEVELIRSRNPTFNVKR